ncbi:PDR/VanB family oxidoreductase [Glaciimonas soli]|uniref:2Fe-2S iron-sulfur cluster binding domain-containing protein n=1 Tax=Glaciimonas soli TaxID=2590999 RepID=A0A843YLI4_9BURK|nr:PDR/VanB family oxidoreductase [Glaciimonas soli]MQR00729.1 2Fe-2S iron-sulfur cluster binding domain-containing protein [Glaciimonas soli]
MSEATLQVKVARKVDEADDICSYELVSADDTPLPPFSAGSHIDVHLRPGLVRQYSLCNSPQEQHRYLICVLRDAASRGGSQAMHDDILAGMTLQISVPKNHFPLVEAERSLLLAGGIGVTPILCMAEALSAQGAAFEMHYCGRSPERTAFLDRIARAPYSEQVHTHYDNGDAAQKFDLPALLTGLNRKTHIYLCGPAGFIDHVLATAKAHDWPKDQIHLEYFGAAAAPDTANDQAFEVKLASSGKVYTIPADCSVLQVLTDAGVFIPASCEQGVCGTCLTRVLDGVPDHRDLYMDEAEQAANDQFTPCCSRAKSTTLLLDL